MTKMLKEFKKQQIMRRIELEDTGYHPAVNGTTASAEKQGDLKKQSQSYLAPGTAVGLKTDLKKQSQFVPDMMGATPFSTNAYGDMSMFGADQNKANPGQFDAPPLPERLLKSKKPPTTLTG